MQDKSNTSTMSMDDLYAYMKEALKFFDLRFSDMSEVHVGFDTGGEDHFIVFTHGKNEVKLHIA